MAQRIATLILLVIIFCVFGAILIYDVFPLLSIILTALTTILSVTVTVMDRKYDIGLWR